MNTLLVSEAYFPPHFAIKTQYFHRNHVFCLPRPPPSLHHHPFIGIKYTVCLPPFPPTLLLHWCKKCKTKKFYEITVVCER